MPKKILPPKLTNNTKQLISIGEGAALMSSWENRLHTPEVINRNRTRIREWVATPKTDIRTRIPIEQINISTIVEIAKHAGIPIPSGISYDTTIAVKGVEATGEANCVEDVLTSRKDCESALERVKDERDRYKKKLSEINN